MAEGKSQVSVNEEYLEKCGFAEPENYVFKSRKGLDEQIIKEISWMKGEPEWMTKFRLAAFEVFRKKPMPNWGAKR